MWYIKDVKRRAWSLLHRTYWKAFAASILVNAITAIASRLAIGVVDNTTLGIAALTEGIGNLDLLLAKQVAMSAMISSPILMILSILLTFPLMVGVNKLYMQLRERSTSLMSCFDAFKNNYSNVVKASFLQTLFVFLWSLLLFIPGIIKYYEYSMIPYLLAENPQMTTKRAFELSKKMTKGEKMRIFVTDFSFIWWILLTFLTCGIGVIFLTPYMSATHAEIYAVMRDKALANGFADETELQGF